MKKIFILFLVSFLLITCKKVAFDILYVDAPAVTTDSVNNIKLDSATVYFKINNPSNFKFVKVGVCYDTSTNNPNISNILQLTDSGVVKGNLKIPIVNLKYNTRYYARGFAIFNDSIFYGNVQTFTTNTLPTVTLTIDSLTNSTASIGLTINNNSKANLSKLGIYYSSTNILPGTKLSDSVKILKNTGVLAGIYNIPLTDLSVDTTYYIRYFYVINGVQYLGTQVQNFKAIMWATLTTNLVTNITNTTATANININNPNNLNITAAGIAYSSSNSIPTTANGYIAHSSTGNLTGNYTLNLSTLTANTTYYVRGYINYNGTIYYGNVQNFTTTNNVLPTTLTLANLESNMVTIPAGSFTMGATSEQLANNGDGFSVTWSPTTQQVTLSTYKICRFEVTQQLWRDVMGNNPSYFNGGSYGTNLQRPVELVSWNDCQTFITKLNQLTGKNYRLPTEAEWEYVARGGLNSTYSYIYSGSNSLNDVAWNINNSSGQTQTVGTKQANALGLYDMTGNVWELCSDWYGNYSNTGVTNPQGPPTGTYRILRGGSFPNQSSLQRTSLRYSDLPTIRNYTLGFRLVLDNIIFPTITTNAVTSITNSTATANINISNPSVLSITATGVAYSSSNSTPTTADAYIAHSSTGNLTGNYTLNLSSLTANTTYYVRGYINYNGTIYYGAVQSFTTTNNVLPTTLNLANLEANMITVPGGSFTMGATSEQLANNGDGFSVFWSPTTQQVTLSTYKICRFEVTQQLWQDVMGNNPSYFTGNLQRPVESVSWNDCQTFISKLNQLTGKNYRLPTEAEWEYAARGGANSTYNYIYSGGNTLNEVAWNGSNSSGQTQVVGTKQANALGLYDMSGNVWEWCNDWYGYYSSSAVTNPPGANSGSYRVIRGGRWGYGGYDYRVSSRGINNPSNRDFNSGLRLTFSSN